MSTLDLSSVYCNIKGLGILGFWTKHKEITSQNKIWPKLNAWRLAKIMFGQRFCSVMANSHLSYTLCRVWTDTFCNILHVLYLLTLFLFRGIFNTGLAAFPDLSSIRSDDMNFILWVVITSYTVSGNNIPTFKLTYFNQYWGGDAHRALSQYKPIQLS